MYSSRYNQLLDLQSISQVRGGIPHRDHGDAIDEMLAGGMGGLNKIADQVHNLGPIDHIARNAYISA